MLVSIPPKPAVTNSQRPLNTPCACVPNPVVAAAAPVIEPSTAVRTPVAEVWAPNNHSLKALPDCTTMLMVACAAMSA